MIDAGIEAELVDDVIALRLAAGDADDAAARDRRQLTATLPTAPTQPDTSYRLAGLRLPDLVQPEPRGDTRHAEDA
jgi:hypothetical protein